MKWIFEVILTAIIIFFVWNILKRIFFTAFYKYTGFNPKANENKTKPDVKNLNTTITKKVNWDAETVDYEEVKENKK